MAKKEINVKMAREVIDFILAEPRRLHMQSMIDRAEDDDDIPVAERPPCGTICCIAGAAIILDAERRQGKRFRQFPESLEFANTDEAAELLGLTATQAVRLFFFKGWIDPRIGWPKHFTDAYLRARTPLQRAKITAKRIRHFIRTNGAE